jgi:O-antigen/teichoic acid export membrane protein
MQDLKERTIRGGFARICAQAANFSFRVGSLMILARLLGPKEFGLVGMVTAFTGILNLFRDFGLSTASVQRANVTEEQMSTLLWVNILVGAVLALLALILAPAIVSFYHEPRLFGITIVLAMGFLFNAAGVQHSALLQRQMRFTALSIISVVSLAVGALVAFSMAKLGFGYWALVAMTVMVPLVTTIGSWVTSGWIPGLPRRRVGIRSMLRFGGTITLNGLVTYVGYNLEKVLLGRFWGAEAIGIYGRAYQLTNIPTDNLNSAVGEVAFSALSRVQGEPVRFRSYFLKGYSLVTGMTLPITLAIALFADDLILVILGPKWKAAAIIFRLLAPTVLIYGMIDPLGWLLFSLGMVGRSLKIGLVLAPIVITGCVLGLPYGPKGVAFAYSAAMTLWLVPHIAWCVHGTMISLRDIFVAVSRPLISGTVAAVVAFGLQSVYGPSMAALPRLVLGSTILLVVYLVMLLYVMGQKEFYLQLLRGFKKSTPVEETALASL